MRILYFGSFYKPYDTEEYISKSLESLGHEVKRVNTTEVETHKIKEHLAENYDFVMFSKGWFKDQKSAEDIFNNDSTLKVGWFFDLCWGTKREFLVKEHHLFKSDIVCTTDGGHDEDWKRLGINHYTLRQGIFESEARLGTRRDEFSSLIGFVGSVTAHVNFFNWKYRAKLLKFLRREYPTQFKWFGNDERKEIRNLDLNDLMASCKIIIGDSVYSKNYWSNRMYETLGRGGFLIAPYIEGIEKEFIPYKHFIPYYHNDWDGLKEKIDYYLGHDKEREKIRLAGFNYCKKYTYKNRCKKLIEIVNEYKSIRGKTQNKIGGFQVGFQKSNGLLQPDYNEVRKF